MGSDESGALPIHNGEPDPDADNPQVEQRPAKRAKLTSASFTRRKRAVAACQFCRLRKTKCDTVKPVCGFCRYHNAKCVYVDPDEDASVQDESTYRHEEILKRFDELKSLLQATSSQLATAGSVATATATATPPAATTAAATLSQSPQAHATPAAASDSDTITSQLPNQASLPSYSPCYTATKCESLLRWPMFEGIISDRDAQIHSFVLSPQDSVDINHTSPLPQTPSFGLQPISVGDGVYLKPAVQEEALVPLCHKFLAHVHPRNPILEPEELLAYAKAAAENGLGWDGPTCLVVRSCSPPLLPPSSPTVSNLSNSCTCLALYSCSPAHWPAIPNHGPRLWTQNSRLVGPTPTSPTCLEA